MSPERKRQLLDCLLQASRNLEKEDPYFRSLSEALSSKKVCTNPECSDCGEVVEKGHKCEY